MKKRIVTLILGILGLFAIILFWIKNLTKLQDFDIFGDINNEEEF